MFTDTDRRFYEIKTDDVYKDLFQDKELFDNSDYPKNSAFFFYKNKKVIMKDVHFVVKCTLLVLIIKDTF